MTDAIRTPDELLLGLPDFAYEPRFREWEGLRLAHLDEGDSDERPVWLMHGEPTWSFLWRRVMPPLRHAGLRCVVPDLPGFGRSDKPMDLGWYSYERHVAAMTDLLEALDLRGATMVVHDWGGPIGMRLFTEHPERFDRLVVLDTGIFTGEQQMTDAWRAFRDFVERTEDLPISMLVKNAVARGLTDCVAAAYDAPFPSTPSKAGARAFPLMIPLTPDAEGAEAGRRVRDALVADERPKLVLWADGDPVLPLSVGRKLAELLGAPEPEVMPNASHFLQEDAGEDIGRRIADWVTPEKTSV